jgi:hypothetical protein
MDSDVGGFTQPASPPPPPHPRKKAISISVQIEYFNNHFTWQPTSCDLKNEASPNKYKMYLFSIAQMCFTKINCKYMYQML